MTRQELIATVLTNHVVTRCGYAPNENILKRMPAKLRAEVLDQAAAIVAALDPPTRARFGINDIIAIAADSDRLRKMFAMDNGEFAEFLRTTSCLTLPDGIADVLMEAAKRIAPTESEQTRGAQQA